MLLVVLTNRYTSSAFDVDAPASESKDLDALSTKEKSKVPAPDLGLDQLPPQIPMLPPDSPLPTPPVDIPAIPELPPSTPATTPSQSAPAPPSTTPSKAASAPAPK